MALIDTSKLPVLERKPGWHGRYFDSQHMTFGHYEFDEGAVLHAHAHEQEEIWQVLEGVLEITIDGVTHRAGAGFVGVVPPHTMHSVKALTAGKAIVVDTPRRDGFAQKP
ncbi:MAG TPA: cupin domain-containing protein [Rhizomicrobium sp.]|nr:cupin domain-containing protein [Rhizomicrobium sp.]